MISGLKPYPVMKDSGVPWLGRVPAHWSTPRLKLVFSEVDRRSGTGEGVLLSLRMQGRLVDHHAAGGKLVPPDALTLYKWTQPGEIVMNRMRAAAGLFAATQTPGLVSPDYAVLRPRRRADVRYFVHLFRTPAMMSIFRLESRGLGTGESGFLRLYTERFGMIAAPVPPVHEQAVIARFLDYVDRRIGRYIRVKQRLLSLLEEQKQAIIHRAVTRGLDPDARLKPSGVEWVGDVPEHWEIWKVGHFATVGNGSTPARANAEYWRGGTYPWLNSGSVKAGRITQADQFVTERALRECHLPRVAAGSVLLAITGQGKTRGTAAVVMIEAAINQHIAFITPRDRDRRAIADYLRTFLAAAYSELRRMSDDSGSTKGALTCEGVRHFRVALPPVDEQVEILRWSLAATSELDATIRIAEGEMSLLREYRSRLITDVVTGKLDVREVATALPDDAIEMEQPETLEEDREAEDSLVEEAGGAGEETEA